MDLYADSYTHKIFMGTNCTRGIADNVREELWSYLALSGLLFLNIGIVLMVYALKKAITHPAVLEVFGIMLILMGVIATLASWYVHRQHRQRQPIFDCSFCCYHSVNNIHCDNSIRTDLNKSSHNGYRTRFSRSDSVHSQEFTPSYGIHAFSTIEFQTYAEYIKGDTIGVQEHEIRKEIRKFKVESQKQKKQVHPQKSKKSTPKGMLSNGGYTQNRSNIHQPETPASSILFQQIVATSRNMLQPITTDRLQPVIAAGSGRLQPVTVTSPVVL